MSRKAAFFDVDGTLVDRNIVHYYIYFASKLEKGSRRFLWQPAFLGKAVYYFFLDYWSRSLFNRVFYRNYRGYDAGLLNSMTEDCLNHVMRPRLRPLVVERLKHHKKNHDKIILVTGSLDFIMRPLSAFLGADDLICSVMKEKDSCLTGELDGEPVGEEEKARRMKLFAEVNELDLSQCIAYADSIADMPMLKAVGHAVAVNPDRRLRRVAQTRGWEILQN